MESGKTKLNYDVVMKDLFQHDRPTSQLTGGQRIVEFLNVELPKVQDQRAVRGGQVAGEPDGGNRRMRGILEQIGQLEGARRDRALAQLLILSGLRGPSRRLTVEVKRMGVIDISKNEFLQEIRREAMAEGRAEMLQGLLESRFGPLPRWVQLRLAKATLQQIDLAAKRLFRAESLEAVLGRR